MVATIKELNSIHTFEYGNKFINYTLVRSKRRKTCEIIVDNSGIILRVPFDKPIEEIEGILQDKMKWIAIKQREIQEEKPELVKSTYDYGSTLPYFGKNYEIKFVFNENQIEKVELLNNQFIVYLQNEKPDQKEFVKNLYTNWLKFEANKIFRNKVEKYSRIVNVYPKRIVLKNLKNRWGSVTSRGVVNFNFNLLKAPEEIIDYIVIHELCHFEIKGHSYHFWDYLKQFVPDYLQHIKWLKRNTGSLL